MNRGQQLFLEKTAQRGDKARIARDLNVDPAKVTRWGTGEKKPDPLERAWLEDNLGIGWRLWDEDASGLPTEAA